MRGGKVREKFDKIGFKVQKMCVKETSQVGFCQFFVSSVCQRKIKDNSFT